MPRIAVVNTIMPNGGGLVRAPTFQDASKCNVANRIDSLVTFKEVLGPLATDLTTRESGRYLQVATRPANGSPLYTNKYYGSFAIGPTVIPADSTIMRKGKVKTPRKYKDWKKLKDDGVIVLSAMESYDFKATRTPGFRRGIATAEASGFGFVHDQLGMEMFPLQNTGCPHLPLYHLGDHTGRFYEMIMRPHAKYKVYNFPGELTLGPSNNDVHHFLNDITEILEDLQPDTAVVTSARSEASAGVIDFATTIAELPETVKMILEAIRLIFVKYKEVKSKVKVLKRNRINEDDTLSQIATLWLQFRYGIMPNVYTIEDSLEYLWSDVVKYQSVRTGARHQIELPPLGDGWVADKPLEVIERCFLKNRFSAATSKPGQLLKANALSTAWELVPLSFVLDWLVNVGDFLSSLFKPTGSVQEAVMSSWQIDKQQIVLSNPDWVNARVFVDLSYYKCKPINPIDHIGLAIDPGFSWKRQLDALALTWNITKGLLK